MSGSLVLQYQLFFSFLSFFSTFFLSYQSTLYCEQHGTERLLWVADCCRWFCPSWASRWGDATHGASAGVGIVAFMSGIRSVAALADQGIVKQKIRLALIHCKLHEKLSNFLTPSYFLSSIHFHYSWTTLSLSIHGWASRHVKKVLQSWIVFLRLDPMLHW